MTKIILLDIISIKKEPKEIARPKLTGMQKLALRGLEQLLPIEVEVKIIKDSDKNLTLSKGNPYDR